MGATPTRANPAFANRRLGLALAGIVAGMVGVSFAAVPLYTLFCQVTGFGGTTQRASLSPDAPIGRVMTVRFDANVAGTDLPWTFEPIQREVKVQVGEERLAYYRARNNGPVALTGTATFNVTPHKAGLYFQKIACFCFAEQRLEPGESLEMPVSFFIDPDIVKDANLTEVATVTLSYTFFRAKSDADGAAKPRAARAGERDANVN